MKALLISVLCLILINSPVFGQNTVLINGYVETLDNIPISGATAELYENGSKVKTSMTGSDGLFSFSLGFNKNYRIVVSKNGMIQKRIDFNTNAPAEKQRKLIKEFAMTLVGDCQGANTAVFDEPVDMVEYDQGMDNFVSNKAYFERMQARIANAYKDIEKCKQDSYNQDRQAADQAMSDGKYEEAKKLYQEALQVVPNDAYAKKQIIQANKNITQQEQQAGKYDQLIKEADQFLAQNQLSAAKLRYADAQKMKPADEYTQKKISEINTLQAQQAQQIQQQQAVNNQYNDVVTKANAAMAAKNYPLAKQLFEQAAVIKPNESFPAQKIAEAQQAMQKIEQQKAEQQKSDNAYQDLMAQGQTAMQQQNYALAQELYQKALTYKPNESQPRLNINEAQRLDALKKKQELETQKNEVERLYREAIQKADGLLAQKEYNNAITAYKQALTIKPTDSYAQGQITRTQNIMVKEQQDVQVAKEQAYNQALALGDAKKLNKEFEAAITAYQQALVAKPNDGHAQNKLSEAQKLLAAQQALLKEETDKKGRYNQLLQEADGYFKAGQLSEARNKYQLAQSIYPLEAYPKNQIAAIDNLSAKNQKETDYTKLISQADMLLAQKKYDEAKTQYAAASQIIPEKTYPQQKINEINALIAIDAKRAVQEKYNALAAQAEQQVSAKNFEQAKTLYAQAQQVMPENPYPRQRINEINKLIDNEARNKVETHYNQLISQADMLFNQQQYDQAKNIYQQAQKQMPEKTYPQQKLNEISQLQSNLVKKKIEDDYMKIIAEADALFKQEKFNEATAAYQRAQKVMPEQTYPQSQINEINRILSEAARIEREKQDKQTAYDKSIALADKLFNEKSYSLARSQYSNALDIYPDKDYPKSKLAEIDQQLSIQQQQESARHEIERKYVAAITQADVLFKNKQYPDAKNYYRQALELKPNDVQSASQIKRIEEIMAQQAAELKRSEDISKRYADLLAEADSRFGSSDFKEARRLYLAALEVKPNEIYPREQIKKTDERLKVLAETQPVNKTTSTSSVASKLAELNFKNESERSKYLADLKTKYSEGVTLEIYNEGSKTTRRYIVVRSGEAHEYRDIHYSWGSAQYTVDGKPSNSFYIQSQVKPREGEKFTEVQK